MYVNEQYTTISEESRSCSLYFSDCQPGNYMDNNKCEQCLAGTYNEEEGQQTECLKCEAGTYSTAGSATCSECEAGKYSEAGASKCYSESNRLSSN